VRRLAAAFDASTESSNPDFSQCRELVILRAAPFACLPQAGSPKDLNGHFAPILPIALLRAASSDALRMTVLRSLRRSRKSARSVGSHWSLATCRWPLVSRTRLTRRRFWGNSRRRLHPLAFNIRLNLRPKSHSPIAVRIRLCVHQTSATMRLVGLRAGHFRRQVQSSLNRHAHLQRRGSHKKEAPTGNVHGLGEMFGLRGSQSNRAKT
jgi:hypothetical protein